MKRTRIAGKKVTKTGVVKALEGRMAVAVTTREEACGHCKARESCEASGTGANATVRALNTAHAQIGDTVTIAMASTSLLKASFVIYMVPILALIGGILMGFLATHLVGIKENIAVGISSGLSLVGAFFWLRKKGRDLGKRKEFIPEVIARKKLSEAIAHTADRCPEN
jgi:sigma-E factor negative regulatory protein RseC